MFQTGGKYKQEKLVENPVIYPSVLKNYDVANFMNEKVQEDFPTSTSKEVKEIAVIADGIEATV